MYKIRVFLFLFFSHTADVSKHIKISTVWGHYSLYFKKRRHSDRVLTVNKGHLLGGWGWDPGMGEKKLFLERAGVMVTPSSPGIPCPSLPPQGTNLPLSPR